MTTSVETKRKIVELHSAGHTITDISRQLNVSPKTIYTIPEIRSLIKKFGSPTKLVPSTLKVREVTESVTLLPQNVEQSEPLEYWNCPTCGVSFGTVKVRKCNSCGAQIRYDGDVPVTVQPEQKPDLKLESMPGKDKCEYCNSDIKTERCPLCRADLGIIIVDGKRCCSECCERKHIQVVCESCNQKVGWT